MYSDMSKRTKDFSLPKRNSAKRRATSVLPTPVGPRNRKHPTGRPGALRPARLDRKSTRLNSSHTVISYAVFCLKKKKQHKNKTKEKARKQTKTPPHN